jgi:hypothetical protein
MAFLPSEICNQQKKLDVDQYDYPTESCKLIFFIFVLQLRLENKLYKSSVMVTAGANQVVMNPSIIFFSEFT